jgi:hypothetical protein
MWRYKILVGVSFLLIGIGFGQNRSPANAPPETKGKAILIRTPGFVPHTLEELVQNADLVVDGVVESVMPTRLANPNSPSSLETDSVIVISKVLKGGDQARLHKVVISQPGGKRGELEIVPTQDPLVHSGERYVLFLTPDTRPNLPAVGDLPRFYLTGAWAGKFKVDKGKIKTCTPCSPGIRAHGDTDVDAFLDRTRAIVAAPK